MKHVLSKLNLWFSLSHAFLSATHFTGDDVHKQEGRRKAHSLVFDSMAIII